VSRVQKPGDIEPVDTGPPDSQSPERDLAGALHEVSNALTVVLGWLECAREEMTGANDIARKAIDIATMHGKLGRRVARRAIGAESDAIEDEADLEALVRDAVTGVEREALRRGVALVITNDPSSRAKIVRSAPSLFQVMTNLLLNAVALSPEGSTVRVETAANGADVRVSVIDSGPGIDSARRTTIFGGGYSSRSGGAGVGLRHAHALASGSGGRLTLADTERGARFDVKWPCVALRPPMSRISSMPGLSLDGVHILLLEDDDAVIGLLSTALTIRGATVHAARSTLELDAATQAQRFDAALLDLSPIAADVGGALQKVQRCSPKVKVVLISGSAAEVPAAAQGMMAAWVRKPFEVGEILAVLRSFSPPHP
jgi:CheY-like chemotaxis protein